ncbi:hypothetical protein [Chryseobacterium sp. 'Rf worker isolate 10']|uniref:hypothetical protein n=1 Tax=Chryseobacterium sp. 'Rf worker isolate 10' TaxID=2887348 RepID=UPI003D6FDD4C
MINLYWPVYKNLEKEVIELSYNINFDDIQFDYLKDVDGKYIKTPTYSVKIGDLLVRCCTEIEALIQELTRGKDKDVQKTPTVDSKRPITTGCRLKYLHNTWDLDQKAVIMSCLSMYFKDEKNKYFFPFQYTKDGYDDYYSAYNAIKHNRNDKTIYKGNIRYLLRAMASLFLLNIYHKNDPIFLGKNSSTDSVPSSSDLFSVETIRATMTEKDNSIKLTLGNFKDTLSAVYIIRTTEESKAKENDNAQEFTDSVNSKIAELIKNNPNENIDELTNRAIQMTSHTKLLKAYENREYEAILIKPESIDFYESQGCIAEYSKDELDQIREEIKLWKSTHI